VLFRSLKADRPQRMVAEAFPAAKPVCVTSRPRRGAFGIKTVFGTSVGFSGGLSSGRVLR